jgi:hypothetical protein
VAHPLRDRPVPGKSEQCPRARVILRKPGPFEWCITPNQWRRNAVMRGRHSGNDDQANNDPDKIEMYASPANQPTNVLAKPAKDHCRAGESFMNDRSPVHQLF